MSNSKIRHPKKRAFLAAYAECGNVTQAAEIAGINRNRHYQWLQEDPNYVTSFEDAKDQAADRLEQEARRRATQGVDEPVFYKGEECGVVRKYSDTLLIFLLNGARPEKYKQRVANEHTGKNGGPIEVKKYDRLSDDEIDELLNERLIAYAKAGAAGTD